MVNVPFAKRGKRTDEYIDVLKALWTTDPSSHHGEFYDLPSCNMHPKPVQQPHPPLVFGGESDAALRRVARHGQGWYTFNRLPDQVAEGMARLEKALAAEGRARSEIAVTACPYFNAFTPEMVDQYADAGVDEVTALFFAMTADDVGPAFDALDPVLERAHALTP